MRVPIGGHSSRFGNLHMSILGNSEKALLRKTVSLLEQLVKVTEEAKNERQTLFKVMGDKRPDLTRIREDNESRLQQIRETADQRHRDEQEFRRQLLDLLSQQTPPSDRSPQRKQGSSTPIPSLRVLMLRYLPCLSARRAENQKSNIKACASATVRHRLDDTSI